MSPHELPPPESTEYLELSGGELFLESISVPIERLPIVKDVDITDITGVDPYETAVIARYSQPVEGQPQQLQIEERELQSKLPTAFVSRLALNIVELSFDEPSQEQFDWALERTSTPQSQLFRAILHYAPKEASSGSDD